MATKKITDLVKLTDLDATDSFVVNDSGAGADKRVEFSDLQSEVLNGASIGTSTAITELQVDNLNLNGNTISSTDTNGNVLIQPNGTGDVVINESGADVDFRVEGDTDQNLLFVDASTDRVGIGTATPASLLDVDGDLTITDKIIHSGDTNTAIRFPSADTVTVETAGSERMRIDSSGNVGIGTNSPGYTVQVKQSDASVAVTASDDSSILRINAQSGVALIETTTNTDVRIRRNSVEKVRITSDGLTFNGDTAAANALDDYEEGTFTPTVYGASTAGTTTYTLQNGYFTKIGRQVTVYGVVTYSAMTGTGELRIGGLPVAIGNLTQGYPIGACFTDNLNWGGGSTMVVTGLVNTTNMNLYYSGDDIGATAQSCVNESAGFRFSLTYFTS